MRHLLRLISIKPSSRTFALWAVVLFATLSVAFYAVEISQVNRGRTLGDLAAIWQSIYNLQSRGIPASSFNCSVHDVIGLTDFAYAIVVRPGLVDCNQLGIHFHAAIYPVAVLAKLFPSPKLLLILQSIVLSGAAIVLYFLSAELGLGIGIATLCAVGFSVNPFIQGFVLNDFHFDAFAPIFIFTLLFLLRRRRWRSIVVVLLLAPFIKETFSMLAAGFGLYLLTTAWLQRSKSYLLAGLGSLAWALFSMALLLKVVMPRLCYFHQFMFGTIYGNSLGNSPAEIVLHFFTRPVAAFGIVTDRSNFSLLKDMLFSSGYIALLQLPTLLLGSGFLFINVVSSNMAMKIPWGQYNIAVIASFWASTVFALAWIQKRAPKVYRWAAAPLLIVLILAFFNKGPIAEDRRLTIEWLDRVSAPLLKIPGEASVCTLAKGAYYLSSRYELFMAPSGLSKCQYLVTGPSLHVDYLPASMEKAFPVYVSSHFEEVSANEDFVVYQRKTP